MATSTVVTQQPQCTCTRNNGIPKLAFHSQQAAEAWFALKQKEHGWTEPQRAYRCPQSSVWHLTSDPEPRPAIAMSQVNYKQQAEIAPVAIRDRIRELQAAEPKLTAKEVAARIGCSVQTVYATRRYDKATSKAAAALATPLNSLAAIADAKRRNAEEAARLEAEEKRLREALLPKVQVFGNNGETQVRITHNGQSYILTQEAALVLKALLSEKVPGSIETVAA